MTYGENSQKNLPSQKIHNYSKSFEKGKERKMKDLSREERLNQRIAELEQEIYETAEKYGNRKWLRIKRTFFVICGVIYFLKIYFSLKSGISDINIDTICGLLFAPIVAAGFIMFISYGILFYIIDNSIKEEKTIAKKIGELNTLKSEKNNNYLDEKTKELKERIELLERIQEKLAEENAYLRLSKLLDDEVEKNEQD